MSTPTSDPKELSPLNDPARKARARAGSPSSAASTLDLFRRFRRRLIWPVALAAVCLPVWLALSSRARSTEPAASKEALQPVAVARVARENLTQDLACEGELRPYQEIDLHAKVAGYLQSIHVDIGDHVDARELLATIEIPELQDEIDGAKAELKRSEEEAALSKVSYDEAHLVLSRLEAVDKSHPNLVAKQDLDAANSKDLTMASSLAAAKAQAEVARAGVKKFQTMLDYTRITAPFAGVITHRYVDPGALIQAGISSSASLPLVRLSENDRLRLDIPVSVSYVSRVHVGDPVQIQVDSLNTNLSGTIARSTRKVDTATRTMEVEVDVANPDLILIPGMYATVQLQLSHRDKTLVVPVEAVSRQKTSTVLVVDPQGRVEERTITLGLETPSKLEVVSGLKENDMVVIGSRAQIKPGQVVEPKLIASENTP